MNKSDPHFGTEAVQSETVRETEVATTSIVVAVPCDIVQPVATIEDKVPSAPTAPEAPDASVDPPREDLLLATQLLGSAPRSNLKTEGADEILLDNVMDLYRWLAPRDPRESILVRHIVALSNVGLECYVKAGESQSLEARELYLKYGMKGSVQTAQLIELLAKLRGEVEPNVSVGNVKVEAGGQAIGCENTPGWLLSVACGPRQDALSYARWRS
jgi:hypothetical protein